MTHSRSKWSFLGQHAFDSATGLIRFLFSHPLKGTRLFWARLKYFITRKFGQPLDMGDGFRIETDRELIAYWSFYVEREGWSETWARAIAAETHPVILDVGANAGLFSHWMRQFKNDAEFILFEPLPRMAAKIEAWIPLAGANAKVIRKAVSDNLGTAKFHLSADNDTTASLKPDAPKAITIEVPVTTLDAEINHSSIFLIKMDVEGCEPEAIRGARRTISRARFLIIEAHTQESLDEVSKSLGSKWSWERVGASDYLFKQACG